VVDPGFQSWDIRADHIDLYRIERPGAGGRSKIILLSAGIDLFLCQTGGEKKDLAQLFKAKSPFPFALHTAHGSECVRLWRKEISRKKDRSELGIDFVDRGTIVPVQVVCVLTDALVRVLREFMISLGLVNAAVFHQADSSDFLLCLALPEKVCRDAQADNDNPAKRFPRF